MTSADPVSSRRVRRSRRVERQSLWRSDRMGPVIFAIMCLVALVHVVLSLRALDVGGRLYGVGAIGMTRSDLRYLLGEPASAPASAPTWQYRLPEGGSYATGFGAGGDKVRSLSCQDEVMAPSSCPGAIGFRLGVTEPEVWYRLGAPSAQRYVRDVKQLYYSDIGVTYSFKRFTLYRIAVGGRTGRWAFVPRLARYLVP